MVLPICWGMRPKGTKQELEARRFHAVALLEGGLRVCEVARRVGATPGAVVRWRDAYHRAGKEGLRAKPHPGSKPKLAHEDRKRLEELLLQGPRAHGFVTELWTLSRVAQLIDKRFGVSYHPCHVWKILRSMGWSCQKPERRARERDEQAIAYWRRHDWPRIKKSPEKRSKHRLH